MHCQLNSRGSMMSKNLLHLRLFVRLYKTYRMINIVWKMGFSPFIVCPFHPFATPIKTSWFSLQQCHTKLVTIPGTDAGLVNRYNSANGY